MTLHVLFLSMVSAQTLTCGDVKSIYVANECCKKESSKVTNTECIVNGLSLEETEQFFTTVAAGDRTLASKIAAAEILGGIWGVSVPLITSTALEPPMPFTDILDVSTTYGVYETNFQTNTLNPNEGTITHVCPTYGDPTVPAEYTYNVFHTETKGGYAYVWAEIDLTTAPEYGLPMSPEAAATIASPIGPNNGTRQYNCIALIRLPLSSPTTIEGVCTHYDNALIGSTTVLRSLFTEYREWLTGVQTSLFNGYVMGPDNPYATLASALGWLPMTNASLTEEVLQLSMLNVQRGIWSPMLTASSGA